MDDNRGFAQRWNEEGPRSRDKNIPPKIILDPLQTNMDCDSNSGGLTFKPFIWKT